MVDPDGRDFFGALNAMKDFVMDMYNEISPLIPLLKGNAATPGELFLASNYITDTINNPTAKRLGSLGVASIFGIVWVKKGDFLLSQLNDFLGMFNLNFDSNLNWSVNDGKNFSLGCTVGVGGNGVKFGAFINLKLGPERSRNQSGNLSIDSTKMKGGLSMSSLNNSDYVTLPELHINDALPWQHKFSLLEE